MVARGWGVWDGVLMLKGYRVSGWGDEKILETDGSDGCKVI